MRYKLVSPNQEAAKEWEEAHIRATNALFAANYGMTDTQKIKWPRELDLPKRHTDHARFLRPYRS
jgi:hypothetical protein